MKNTISTLALSLFASAAFAQSIPVSASAVADDVSASYAAEVSAPTLASDAKDGRRPAPSVSESDCCGVPVSAPQAVGAEEDSSGAVSMAGLGFGLFGLMGVAKLARRKKAKGTETM
jgi:hypothetical protein